MQRDEVYKLAELLARAAGVRLDSVQTDAIVPDVWELRFSATQLIHPKPMPFNHPTPERLYMDTISRSVPVYLTVDDLHDAIEDEQHKSVAAIGGLIKDALGLDAPFSQGGTILWMHRHWQLMTHYERRRDWDSHAALIAADLAAWPTQWAYLSGAI